jgi:hypothetical protein
MVDHAYIPGESACDCSDASDHAPCVVCDAGRDAFQHHDEPHPEVAIVAGDTASGTDKAC